MLEGEKVAKNRKLKEVLCVVFRSLKKTRKKCVYFVYNCLKFHFTYTTYKPSHHNHSIIPLSNHHTIIILKSIELRNIYVYVSCGEGKKEHGVHHRFFLCRRRSQQKQTRSVFVGSTYLLVVCKYVRNTKNLIIIYCVHTIHMDPFFSTPKTTRKKKKKRDRRQSRFLFV